MNTETWKMVYKRDLRDESHYEEYGNVVKIEKISDEKKKELLEHYQTLVDFFDKNCFAIHYTYSYNIGSLNRTFSSTKYIGDIDTYIEHDNIRYNSNNLTDEIIKQLNIMFHNNEIEKTLESL